MSYYFPSLLPSLEFTKQVSDDLPFSFASGEQAIRVLLRSYQLPPGACVALPLYVCDSLKQAVLQEGLTPYYLDLKPGSSFWSEYNLASLEAAHVKAVILVHLYGFLHPDTDAIMQFCQTNRVPLLHDAAQSYGINVSALTYGNGTVYSFGPGKSSTAACGAIAEGLSSSYYNKEVNATSESFSVKERPKLFLKSRLYGYRFSVKDKLVQRFLPAEHNLERITAMTLFQRQAANAVMKLVQEKIAQRKANYTLLATAAEKNAELKICYDDGRGLYFKLIVHSNCQPELLKKYLHQNQVPYFCLFDSLVLERERFGNYPVFLKEAPAILEISCEASVPLTEIKRVAELIEAFRP